MACEMNSLRWSTLIVAGRPTESTGQRRSNAGDVGVCVVPGFAGMEVHIPQSGDKTNINVARGRAWNRVTSCTI